MNNANPETNAKNIEALKQHSEITRGIVRDVQNEVVGYRKTIKTLMGRVEELQTQVQKLQLKLFDGGATNGD
jgi:polyhydroxyalkanoate synthesis regulator phasin